MSERAIRAVVDMLAVIMALMGAAICVVSVVRQRHLKKLAQPPTVYFEPFQEIGLLLLFALGGEVFTSFFVKPPVISPIMGCVLAVLSSIGARNRLKAHQNEANEMTSAAQAVLRCHGWLCLGTSLMAFAILGWLAYRLCCI